MSKCLLLLLPLMLWSGAAYAQQPPSPGPFSYGDANHWDTAAGALALPFALTFGLQNHLTFVREGVVALCAIARSNQ